MLLDIVMGVVSSLLGASIFALITLSYKYIKRGKKIQVLEQAILTLTKNNNSV